MVATEQTGIRERRTCPSVEEYIALRRETSGVKVIQDKALNFQISVQLTIFLKTFYPLLEHALEIEVPDKAFHHPVIEEFLETANDIISWGNVSIVRSEAKVSWLIESVLQLLGHNEF